MASRLQPGTLAIGLALFAVAALGTLAILNRRDQVAVLGEEIRYDDFAFAVLGSRQVELLGSGTSELRPRGIFSLVTLKVINHAQRVDCRLSDFTPLLVDTAGQDYSVDRAAQELLAAQRGGPDPCAVAIPAGGSCTTELAFDVPADARELLLHISSGMSFFDLVDVVFLGRKTLRLK